jgi:hypothetical protein
VSHDPGNKILLLSRAALQVADDPTFMASALRTFAGGEFDTAKLARHLATDEDSIVRLALCRRPATRPEQFSLDIGKIAKFSGIAVEKLAAIVRHADAMAAFRQNAAPPLLAAARDKIDPDDPDSSSS